MKTAYFHGKQIWDSSLSYRNSHNDVIRMSLMLFILFLVFFRIVNYLLLPPKAKLNTKKATTTSHNNTRTKGGEEESIEPGFRHKHNTKAAKKNFEPEKCKKRS